MISKKKNNIEKAMTAVVLGKQTKQPILIVLMGLPGSGKSYLSTHLKDKYGMTRLSGESITYALYGTDKCSGEQYKIAYKTLRQIAKKILVDGYNVIIDGTNLKHAFRENIYKDTNCKRTVLFYLMVEKEAALDRVAKRQKGIVDRTNVASGCSEEAFIKFQSQLELPVPSENSYTINSDDRLLSRADDIIRQLL